MGSDVPPLWPHQEAAIGAVLTAQRLGADRGLVVLPTGTGKTRMVLELGRRLGDVPVLFLVNRDELLVQTLKAAARFWPGALAAPIRSGRADWDHPTLDGRRPLLAVGMVPTLANRLASVAPDRFGLVVADEAHLFGAPTFRKVLGHFTPGFTLGVTATPARHDGGRLDDLFGAEPLYSYSLHQAIKDGRLVPVRVETVRTEVDLGGVGSDGVDLAEAGLARAVNTLARNRLVAEAYLRHARGRRAAAFCVDVPHAEALARALRDAGVRACAVTGTMKAAERRDAVAAFAAGDFDVVTNCEVLTTGWDDPGVSCLLMARPTESRSLYVQMAGRGLRLHPGKADCLLLDFVDVSGTHKLVCAPDLLGRRREAKEEAAAAAEREKRGPAPAPDGAAVVSWALESACPWPELPSLEGYAPTGAAWQAGPASPGQLRYLAAFGLAAGGAMTKGEASYLIDRCREFEAAYPAPATPRQRQRLAGEGLWQDGMSKRQARALLGLLEQAQRGVKEGA